MELEGIDKGVEQVATLFIIAVVFTIGMSSKWVVERQGAAASFWDRLVVTFLSLVFILLGAYVSAKLLTLAGGVVWSRTRREAYKNA